MRSISALLLALSCFAFAASAAQYPPELRWRTITTKHFDIHYHTGEEELAQRASAIAERVHDRIVPLVGWEPHSRTQLVLSDAVDISNGSATMFPYNRIEVWVSAPGADPSSALEFYDNWLGLVITHEYTHILHLDQAFGTPNVLRRIFGRSPLSFPNMFSPLWMTEGIATFVESQATNAGRLKGTFVEMILRTAAIENAWSNEPRASGLTPEWPAGSARYYYGSKFLEYVARREGTDHLMNFFHRYASHIVPYRIESAAEKEFGESLSRLWEDWTRDSKAKYAKELAALAQDGVTKPELLTSRGYETKYPAVSPDGKLVAFAHQGPYGRPTIEVLDLTTSMPAVPRPPSERGRPRDGRHTTPADKIIAKQKVNSISHLSWSADGRTIAFSQLEYHRSFSILSDIYTWDYASKRVRRLTTGKRLKDPAFTPDAREILAVENRAGRNRLVAVDVASGAIRTVVEPPGFIQFSEPEVSHDGRHIAVAQWENGRVDIVLYDHDGKNAVNLTRDLPLSINASPRFSLDDRKIFFSSDITGISNAYELNVADRSIERLTNVYGGVFFPVPDGDRIVYANYSSRGFDLASTRTDLRFAVTPRTLPTAIAPVEEATQRSANASSRPYTAWNSLRPRWWFPASSVAGDEAIMAIQTSGADALGFHQYTLELGLQSNKDSDAVNPEYGLIYSYDRFYPTITLLANQYYDTDNGITITNGGVKAAYRERIRRTALLSTFPIRKLQWQLYPSIGFVRDEFAQKLPFAVPPDIVSGIGLLDGTLQGIRAGVAFNSTREYGYSISPENGVLAEVDWENLSKELGSDVSRRELRADVRGFVGMPFGETPLARHVAAVRVAAGATSGEFLIHRELEVGGVGSSGLLNADTHFFPVRGFDSGELRGDTAAVASFEYRLPIHEIERGPAVFPLFFHRLIGAAFVEAGSAWNREPVELEFIHRPKSDPFQSSNTLASAGAEVGLDMFLGFYVPVRYRLGIAIPLQSPEGSRNPSVYAAFGSSF